MDYNSPLKDSLIFSSFIKDSFRTIIVHLLGALAKHATDGHSEYLDLKPVYEDHTEKILFDERTYHVCC